MVYNLGGAPILNVDRIDDVLIVSGYDDIWIDDFRGFASPKEVIMTIVNGDGEIHNKGLSQEACNRAFFIWFICVMTQSSRCSAILPSVLN